MTGAQLTQGGLAGRLVVESLHASSKHGHTSTVISRHNGTFPFLRKISAEPATRVESTASREIGRVGHLTGDRFESFG